MQDAERLRRGFTKLADGASGESVRAVAHGAELLAEKARRRAPRDSGELRESIRVEREAEGAAVIVDDPSAVFVEYGTVLTAAQPFLRPSIRDVEDEMPEAIARALFALLGG